MYWIDRFRHLAACAAMAVLCTGCAPMQTPPPLPAQQLAPPAPPPPPAPAVVYVPMPTPQDLALQQLLAFQTTLSKTPPAEWPREADRLSEGISPSVADTMKLALLLAHTRTNGDVQRALGLLDKVQANPSDEARAWHGLARMLATLLSEQRRQDEQIEKLQQQLRDTQRDNQRRLDQLNEKLEALKSIERSLNNRAPALPQPPSSGPSPAQAPAQPAAKSAPRP